MVQLNLTQLNLILPNLTYQNTLTLPGAFIGPLALQDTFFCQMKDSKVTKTSQKVWMASLNLTGAQFSTNIQKTRGKTALIFPHLSSTLTLLFELDILKLERFIVVIMNSSGKKCWGGNFAIFFRALRGHSNNTWHLKGLMKCHTYFFAFWKTVFNAFGGKFFRHKAR